MSHINARMYLYIYIKVMSHKPLASAQRIYMCTSIYESRHTHSWRRHATHSRLEQGVLKYESTHTHLNIYIKVMSHTRQLWHDTHNAVSIYIYVYICVQLSVCMYENICISVLSHTLINESCRTHSWGSHVTHTGLEECVQVRVNVPWAELKDYWLRRAKIGRFTYTYKHTGLHTIQIQHFEINV